MGCWRGALRIAPPQPSSSMLLPNFCSVASDLLSALSQGRHPPATLAPKLDLSALDVSSASTHIFPAFTPHPLILEQARLFQDLEAMRQKTGRRNCGSALAETFDSRTRLAESFGSVFFIPVLRSTVRLPGAFGTDDFTMEADSVKRKRKRKMNKHKHRKLRRRLRKSGK